MEMISIAGGHVPGDRYIIEEALRYAFVLFSFAKDRILTVEQLKREIRTSWNERKIL